VIFVTASPFEKRSKPAARFLGFMTDSDAQDCGPRNRVGWIIVAQ
jgi:hypothetical protein